MRPLLACLLLILALPVSAQIYKYTDSNGNTVFTNQPPDGIDAQSVELKQTNTVQPPPAPATPPSSAPQAAEQAPYRVLALTDLPDGEALRANNGTFSVGVHIVPRLSPGHSLRLLLDGKPYGRPSNVTRLQLSQIDRGEHSLAVEVLSGDQVLQQSDTVTFTVQRVNTSSPALRPPPPPPPRPAN
ncbi:DUF4124 domain-containing protein [Phytopseudomonas dryadis]|uniref:DUF4124 domain-containing protein n=1 Tax=Phytopseudomonas dryadis TaxID=2487520 RepID=A0A4Q9QWJ1_9GAMM|nr:MULTISPECIES: DUF4124 domain-containing protein [Pseudomonas]TBU87421.1 DUF4124 domain-containing protein [Pseudomonas dryadis]TBV02283.1 DUF4124 domain-containing protein [Pseudomonas dryadis]TBV15227.1 DUF4124 domain-containing protein [Pseudomonas sp. FRB 230]